MRNAATLVAFIGSLLTCLVDGPVSHADVRAGAARADITPPVGIEIQHYFRISVGVRDPLMARCLYLADERGTEIAIVCLDLIFADFDACDAIRTEVSNATGIGTVLLAFSHSHSSMALGPRGRTTTATDQDSEWNDATIDAIVDITRRAQQNAEPARLRVGRAQAQVGFNRRLIDPKSGHVYMRVNREGPVVPWVNVLVADSNQTGKPIAILYEHAAHPVIVPDNSKLISADFPGAAAKRIHEEFGEDVIALFGQGCCGNINGFPLRTTHENAEKAGAKLGDSVIKAVNSSIPLESDAFKVRQCQTTLPSHRLPDIETWQKWYDENQQDERRAEQLNAMRPLIVSEQQPPPRRFDAYAISLGDQWCLTTMPHEMFCQYELFVDEHAPFQHTMTLAYTNGYEGYIAVDAALAMDEKAGYEAGSLPNWYGQVWTQHFGPPAVGAERIVKQTLVELWKPE